MEHRPAEHPSPEALLDVVHDLADGQLQASVLEHVRVCERCAEEMRHIGRTRELLRSEGVPSSTRRGHARSVSRSIVRSAAAVATLAAAASLVLWLSGRQPASGTGEPGQYWLAPPTEVVALRAESGDAPAELLEALRIYDRHLSQSAAEALRASNPPVAWLDLRDVYLASALVNAGRHSEAAEVLDALDIYSLPYEFRQPARWMEYLVLAASGSGEEARSRLEQLVDDPGEIGDLARKAVAQGSP